MDKRLFERLEDNIKKYQETHRGESPLYVLVSPDEADSLLSALNEKTDTEQKVITSYKGSKIVGHEIVNKGQMLSTNELPETSS